MGKTPCADDIAALRPTVAGMRRVRELYDALRANAAARVGLTAFTELAPFVGLPAAPALDRAVRQYVRAHSRGTFTFVKCVLRPAVACALEFETLFALTRHPSRAPGQTFVELQSEYVSLSRRQLFCIVSNAFFGTFAPRPQNADDALPTIDYADIHSAPDGANDVEVVKLRLLFDYFAKVGALSRGAAVRPTVEVFRCSLSPASSLVSPTRFQRRMEPPVVHALKESIDDQGGMLRLDFANRWIGGGALSDGCVQEEITFAQCPELNALRWFHGPMGETEAVVVRGYCQYASVKDGTYGYGIKYGGALPRAKRLGGALLAVDAVDYRYEETAAQYSPAYIERELVKLMSALSVSALDSVEHVAGGNWGCGVFCGDVELKFLIQWLACHLCHKVLHFFPYDRPIFTVYAPAVRQLCRDGLTGEQLMAFLLQLWNTSVGDEGGRGGSVISELLLYLAGTQDTECPSSG